MTLSTAVAAAYGATGAAWADGPGRIYSRLAEVVCDRSPVPLSGARALDVGAGTGAASTAALRRGAEVVAVDIALGMLAARRDRSVPGVAADAGRLPFSPRSFDAVIAAFSLNHLLDPAAALIDVRRVLRPGGGAVAAAYAEGDTHPVKPAVDRAAEAAGWRPPAWYERLHTETIPLMATQERAEALAKAAGIAGARAERVEVSFPELDAEDLVAWRLGMAQLAPFVSSLSEGDRRRLTADALACLGGDFPPLSRSLIVLAWREP